MDPLQLILWLLVILLLLIVGPPIVSFVIGVAIVTATALIVVGFALISALGSAFAWAVEKAGELLAARPDIDG